MLSLCFFDIYTRDQLSYFLGVSLTTSLPCLYYLLRKRKWNASHMVVVSFSCLISAFNVVALILKTLSIGVHIKQLRCPMHRPTAQGEMGYIQQAFQLGGFSLHDVRRDMMIQTTFPLVFLWITDAFLVSYPFPDSASLDTFYRSIEHS